VEMHGGGIEAHSDGPRCGSEFVVRLPLLPVEPPVAVPVPRAQIVVEAARSLRVLIVDDNADSASSVATLLQLQGHEVHVEHAGHTALRAAADYRPDVILLDIGLPGMNGYEIARRLRENPQFNEVSLIAVTGYGREADVQQAAQAGFNHHLVKPVDYDKLTGLLTAREVAVRQA
jgi:CheY-like chemotaxis protein